MSTKFITIGRLRRDLMMLASGDDQKQLTDDAEKAVREGRAAEAFVIPVAAYFSEADHNWDPEKTNEGSKPSSVPPLNPSADEQESLATSDRPFTTPRLEIEKANQEQQDSGEMVDTGSNPDFTPTGKARSEEELKTKESGGQTKGEIRTDAPSGSGTTSTSAKTESLDVKDSKAK